MEVAVDRVDQDGECGFGSEAAGLPERENSLCPMVSFFAGGPKAALAPHDGEADDPLGEVVGWGHPLFVEKDPKGIHFPQETAGKPAGLILAVEIAGDQVDEPCVEGSPLAYGGRGMGHVTQPLEFSHSPAAKGCDLWVTPFAQGLGVADQVGQTALPEPDPLAVEPIAVTDQDALPVADEALESRLRSLRMDHEQGHHGADHDPQPHQHPVLEPGGLVHMVDRCLPGLLGDLFVVGLDGPRHPINHLLDGPKADGKAQDRGAKALDERSALALVAGHLADHGGEPRAVSAAVFLGNQGFVELPTTRAVALVQDEMDDLHLDLGKLDDLMGIVRCGLGKLAVATWALGRFEVPDLGWIQHGLTMALVPFLGPRFPMGLLGGFALGVGAV
jgi:hypothetical protein